MKKKMIVKLSVVFVLMIALSTFANVNAQDDTDAPPVPENRTLTNGFSIKVVLGIPSASYGTDYDVESSQQYGILYGLQIGNQWYFSPGKKMGFGLMVNWFDFTAATKSVGDEDRATYDLTVLELGPIATYALSPEMAIDAFYNLRPTTIVNRASGHYDWEGESYYYDETWQGIALTHVFGANFRWRALSVGMEYVFGSVTEDKYFMFGDSGYGEMKANSFRFVVGAKF